MHWVCNNEIYFIFHWFETLFNFQICSRANMVNFQIAIVFSSISYWERNSHNRFTQRLTIRPYLSDAQKSRQLKIMYTGGLNVESKIVFNLRCIFSEGKCENTKFRICCKSSISLLHNL